MTIDKNIFIKNIYYMLAYAFRELRQDNYASIAGEKFENVNQLLAEILKRGVAFQLKQGLHKEYASQRDAIINVKGKVNVYGTLKEKQLRRARLVCDFDELSVDCVFNRIIKTTIGLLLKKGDIRQEQKNALKKILLFFSEVSFIDSRLIHWDQLRFDRNTRTYHFILQICHFILDDMLLTTESGEYRLPTFSDGYMCKLFEKFILEYYRKEHPETKARAKQIRWNIDSSCSDTGILPVLQTDIYLTLKNRILIIDAKYYSHTMQSKFDRRTIHSNNLNQILVYVLNEDGNRQDRGTVDGMLLYAKTDEDIVPDGQMKWQGGNIISFRTLDLNLDFTEIKRQLDRVIR